MLNRYWLKFKYPAGFEITGGGTHSPEDFRLVTELRLNPFNMWTIYTLYRSNKLAALGHTRLCIPIYMVSVHLQEQLHLTMETWFCFSEMEINELALGAWTYQGSNKNWAVWQSYRDCSSLRCILVASAAHTLKHVWQWYWKQCRCELLCHWSIFLKLILYGTSVLLNKFRKPETFVDRRT